MRKLSVFNHISLDGYFVDATGDMSWAHKSDPEWLAFVQQNASSGGGELVFGRVTYDMMASYWPTPMAMQNDPVVAEGMNAMPKVVFSKTMKFAAWSNTRVLSGDLAAETRALKQVDGPNLLIFGSGTIVSQLTQAGLIDSYEIVVNPIVLGSGRSMFVDAQASLKLVSTRSFGNGNVVMRYERAI